MADGCDLLIGALENNVEGNESVLDIQSRGDSENCHMGRCTAMFETCYLGTTHAARKAEPLEMALPVVALAHVA